MLGCSLLGSQGVFPRRLILKLAGRHVISKERCSILQVENWVGRHSSSYSSIFPDLFSSPMNSRFTSQGPGWSVFRMEDDSGSSLIYARRRSRRFSLHLNTVWNVSVSSARWVLGNCVIRPGVMLNQTGENISSSKFLLFLKILFSTRVINWPRPISFLLETGLTGSAKKFRISNNSHPFEMVLLKHPQS